MKVILLILSFLLIGCGIQKGAKSFTIVGVPRVHEVSNPVFDEYIAEFESFGEVKVVDIPINFGELTGSVVGECRSYVSGKKEIIISREYWNAGHRNNRELLIMHELGHCALNRIPHVDDKVGDLDLSIMHDSIINRFRYADCKAEYMKELHYGIREDIINCLESL